MQPNCAHIPMMSGSRTVARRLGAVAAVAALVAVAFWAGTVVVHPSEEPVAESGPELYTVDSGTVSQSITYPARAHWSSGPTGMAPGSGTITDLSLPADGVIHSGDVLYSLDLRPVTAVAGEVPAFRDLRVGVSGDDVTQLQQYLITTGYLSGGADGFFGSVTARAVRAWQAEEDMTVDGVVHLGEVLFLPLPARAYWADGVNVGTVRSRGQPVLRTVVGAPSLALAPASRDEAPQAAEGTKVTVTIGEQDVRGVTGDAQRQSDGTTLIPVIADDEGPVCDESCAARVPVPGPVDLTAEVTVAEPQTGPVIPVSAIRTRADGATEVTMAGGKSQEVEVLVSYGGLAVVSGVDVGDVVELFGDE